MAMMTKSTAPLKKRIVILDECVSSEFIGGSREGNLRRVGWFCSRYVFVSGCCSWTLELVISLDGTKVGCFGSGLEERNGRSWVLRASREIDLDLQFKGTSIVSCPGAQALVFNFAAKDHWLHSRS